jgi:hypothetical protein
MKIMKNTFSTLVFELFLPSIENCRKLKIQKIQKLTSPTGHVPAWTEKTSLVAPQLICIAAGLGTHPLAAAMRNMNYSVERGGFSSSTIHINSFLC